MTPPHVDRLGPSRSHVEQRNLGVGSAFEGQRTAVRNGCAIACVEGERHQSVLALLTRSPGWRGSRQEVR